MANFDIKDPKYNDKMRRLETTDKGHAGIFNELFGQLLENDMSIKNELNSIIPITFADIDDIDDTAIKLPEYEGDVTDSDIDNIINN